MTSRTRWSILISIGLGSACSDPCTELAKSICDCSVTISEQQACTQRVTQAGKKSSFSAAQKEQCETWIDTCDPVCETLKKGELEKCGLANESLSSLTLDTSP